MARLKPGEGTRKANGTAKANGTEEKEDDDFEQCETCSRWKEIRRRLRVTKILTAAIKKLEEKLKTDDFKPTVAEYLKLVEIEEELEQNSHTPKEIQVTWVDAKPVKSDSGE
jgi:hypothetical protein